MFGLFHKNHDYLYNSRVYEILWLPKMFNGFVACMVQAANEGKWVVAKECELHETSTVRTTVYGSNTVQVYVQSLS